MRRLSVRRLWAVTWKEVRQLRRDRRSLMLAFLLPAMMLVLFGYAISLDVHNVPVAVVDQDHTSRSRELSDALGASGYLTVTERPERTAEIGALFDRGRVQLALVIPPGYAADLARGAATVQAIADGADANTATIALAQARGIILSHGASLSAAQRSLPVELRSRVWFNENMESRAFIVPGLLAVIMSTIAAMLTSLTVAREWERGTMEQLVATPVHRVEVVIGKLLPYLGIGLVDVAAVTLIGVLLFHVPFRGSVPLFGVLSLLFLVGALGLGMFFSTVTHSQLLSTQLAMFATYLPAFLLSGFLSEISAMPVALQLVTYAVPARYFVVVTQGIFLKGVGAEVLFVQALMMLAFAAFGLGLAVFSFKKELR